MCPKCKKDISLEQTKINLPTYMPEPPRLLDVLTGMSDDSPMDFNLADNINQKASILDQQMDLESDESGTVEMPEEAFNQDLDMGLDFDSINESDAPEETVMYSEPPALESLEPDDTADITPPPLPKEEPDEITLDLDDVSDEQELTEAVAQATGEIEALELDLDEIMVDETSSGMQLTNKGHELDEAEMITMEINKKKKKAVEEIEDIELDGLDFDEIKDK
jgi:hypothetical protein